MNKVWKIILILIITPIIGLLFFTLAFFSAGLWSDMQFSYPILNEVRGELLFLGIIAICSWLIWKSEKIQDTLKAIYSIIPTSTILAIVAGFNDGRWTNILRKLYFIVPLFLYLGYIWLLNIAKKSWIYYYAVTLAMLAICLFGLFGSFSPS